ncbi:lipopolysaccharide heptosyltransferase II [bacterium]|nr:lipopolysaccharide heptosyltransferase II [bacterium]
MAQNERARITAERILLVQTSFLGDLVLSTPVISALQEIFPAAKISLLTTVESADLVRSDPHVNAVITFDKRRSDAGLKGLFRLAKQLRGEKFDLAVSLHRSWRTAVLLFLAGIPRRVGFAEASARFLYTQTCPGRDLEHAVLRNLAIVRNFGVDPQTLPADLKLCLPQAAREKAAQVLQTFGNKRIVTIAPGSVWLTKRWLPEYFAEVARQLNAADFAVCLVGGPSDREAAQLIETTTGSQVLNLVGKLTLIESAAVIAKSELLITNDSAPLHIGSAFKVPTAAIFCATVPEFGFGPWQNRHLNLGVEGLSCRPCGRHGRQYCPTGTHACRKNLTPEMVVNAVQQLLTSCQPAFDPSSRRGLQK